MTPEIVTIVSFAGIALIAAAAMLLIRDLSSSEGVVHRRLAAGKRNTGSIPKLPEVPAPGSPGEKSIARWVESLQSEAGVLSNDPSTGPWLLILSGLLVGGALLVWFDNLIIAIVGGLMGAVAMLGFLMYRRAWRRNKIREQLPLAIDLIVRAVRAGESFDQAVSLVGQSVADPLGAEFRRCARQMEMGLSVESTMQGLVRRTPVLETRILASTVTMQRQSGGNLPLTLERIAQVVRERLDFQRQFRSITATSRFSIFLICMAVPGLFAYLFFAQREYMDPLLVTRNGQIMLAIAGSLLVVGLAWIFNLLNTDY